MVLVFKHFFYAIHDYLNAFYDERLEVTYIVYFSTSLYVMFIQPCEIMELLT
jgi:hypothetical protein